MEAIPSGIKKLDELIDGGFRHPSTIYLVGEPGAGKTTFAMQYLCEGAKKGEKGVYFSVVGESAAMVIEYMSQYTFWKNDYLGEFIEFVDLSNTFAKEGIEKAIDIMKKTIEKMEPARAVIDSITPFSLKASSESEHRALLYDLYLDMKAWGCTTVVLGEVKGDRIISTEEYMADAVIKIGFLEKGIESVRYIKIKKMRGVNHSNKYHTLEITPEGMVVSRFSEFDAGFKID